MDGNSIIPTEAEHDEHYSNAPICEHCSKELDEIELEASEEMEDNLCDFCRSFIYATNLEKGWQVYLSHLPSYASEIVQEIDDNLKGWSLVEAELNFEKAAGKVSICAANYFRFTAAQGKIAVVFSLDGITLKTNQFTPDWFVKFPFTTPIEIILAACMAAVNTH